MDNTFTSYVVEERSYISFVKREIHGQAMRKKFSERQIGEIDIIVSELSSNLIKHAGHGEMAYRMYDDEEGNSIFEIVCLDNGPGITDVPRMMKDGVSTTRTLGHGLGAIERLSSVSQLYSLPGWGTIHYAMVTTKEPAVKMRDKTGMTLDITALCINKPRETVCGDGYRVKYTETETKIFFGDGLGHGQHAKDAVDRAGDFFSESDSSDPVEIIRQMHEKVRRTRGLVGTVAIFNHITNEWKLCGVGNILTRMYSGIQYKTYMSYNGTVGLNLPNSMSSSIFQAERNQHLIMCSDGIQTRWDLNRYPSVFKYDNIILAAAVYKDFTRRNDDSSIVIGKVS